MITLEDNLYSNFRLKFFSDQNKQISIEIHILRTRNNKSQHFRHFWAHLIYLEQINWFPNKNDNSQQIWQFWTKILFNYWKWKNKILEVVLIENNSNDLFKNIFVRKWYFLIRIVIFVQWWNILLNFTSTVRGLLWMFKIGCKCSWMKHSRIFLLRIHLKLHKLNRNIYFYINY